MPCLPILQLLEQLSEAGLSEPLSSCTVFRRGKAPLPIPISVEFPFPLSTPILSYLGLSLPFSNSRKLEGGGRRQPSACCSSQWYSFLPGGICYYCFTYGELSLNSLHYSLQSHSLPGQDAHLPTPAIMPMVGILPFHVQSTFSFPFYKTFPNFCPGGRVCDGIWTCSTSGNSIPFLFGGGGEAVGGADGVCVMGGVGL